MLRANGKYRAQLRFTYQGKQRPEWLDYPDTPANRKKADAYGYEIHAQIRKGTFDYAREFPDSEHAVLGEAPTLKEAFKKWVLLYEKGFVGGGKKKRKRLPSPRSIYEHQYSAGIWCRMLGKDTPITKLTYDVLEEAIAQHPWSPGHQMFNHRMDTLRMVFRYWRRKYPSLPDLYDESHEATQHRAAEVRKKVDPLTAEERDRILADLYSHYDERIGHYFAFQFHSGMRPEETVALMWEATELGGTVPKLEVRRTRSFRGVTREGKAKTDNSLRSVELSEEAVKALVAMRKYTTLSKHGHVFENPTTGQPWQNAAKPGRLWNATLTRLKLAHRTAYCCRHTWATIAIMSGLPAKYVAKQMGTSLKLLDQTYTTWMERADAGRQIEQLNQYIRAGGSNVL